VRLLADCAALGTPVTFRAAGTSLSGQAISDSVLVLLGDGWRRARSRSGRAKRSRCSPASSAPPPIAVSLRIRPQDRPDPASIDAAMIGGIAANNASGMCCGTAQNSYHTLAGMRVVLANGTVLDTRDPASRAAFASAKPISSSGSDELARDDAPTKRSRRGSGTSSG
jgi:D-lactate dehydrogenase